jgi:thioredoxin-like negative regulator of GroEL
MKYLMFQDEFEQLLGRQPIPEGETLPAVTVIYFTASWCGACRRLNMPELEDNIKVNWLKCDVDQNNYTPGYCGVKSIPAFVMVKDKQAIGPFVSSSNEKVEEWIKSNL